MNICFLSIYSNEKIGIRQSCIIYFILWTRSNDGFVHFCCEVIEIVMDGLSALLEKAGFSEADVRHYLELSRNSGTEAARMRMLHGQRGRIIDELQRRQQVLDQVDYLIWQTEKENGNVKKERKRI